jgi:spore germination cell wall hydrolase CwlJ-like protein
MAPENAKTLRITSAAYAGIDSRRRMAVLSLTLLCAQLIAMSNVRAAEPSLTDDSRVGHVLGRIQQIAQTYTIARHDDLSASAHLINELRCLALNIYFEARSEPALGQQAVAHVVMNRVRHAKYPDSVCEVVQQGGEKVRHRCQFSWWCDGRSDSPVNQSAWKQSLRLAWKVYFGILDDSTDGALWYHATYVTPYWSDILLKGDRIGQHVFYLESRTSRETL